MGDTIVRGYSLGKDEIQVIKEKAAAMGNSSNSAALRQIIREWALMNEGEQLNEEVVGE